MMCWRDCRFAIESSDDDASVGLERDCMAPKVVEADSSQRSTQLEATRAEGGVQRPVRIEARDH